MQLTNSNRSKRLMTAYYLCLGLILAINFASVCYWLDIESLWIDELFTAYFSDPSQPTFLEVVTRTLEDVHPPVYYLITWATTRLSGFEFTIVARAQSALFSVVALAIVYRSFPSYVSTYSRLFSLAAAVTSLTWFNFALDARSYGLVFIIGALFVMVGLQTLDSISRHEIQIPLLFKLSAIGICGSMVHYYLLLLAGGVVGMLLLMSRNWRQRFAFAATGLAILVPVALFIRWHSHSIVLDIGNTWFSTDFEFLMTSISTGFAMMFGTTLHRILIMGIFAGAILSYLLSAKDEELDKDIVRTYVFIIGCFLTPILLGLAVSILTNPIFSGRVFTVVMPFYWVLVGMATNTLFTRFSHASAIGLATVSILVLFVVSTYRFYNHGLPPKQNWRDSAAAIEKLESCKNEIIPVVGFANPVTSIDNIYYTYGYYLTDRRESDWLKLPPAKKFSELAQTPYAELIRSRISGAQECPVILWSVHHLEKPHIEALIADIRKEFHPIGSNSIIIREWGKRTFVVMIVKHAEATLKDTENHPFIGDVID
ncbi:MAG: hypothetical protein GY761_17175 [Hyphomicrobiales bacterium]|nr:hypothetical protein [Hyphomicrobiales bacterium]